MTSPNRKSSGRVMVAIDPELQDLVPGFLENRRKDAAALDRAAQAKDLNTVRLLGHRMKGDGGGYGFHEISKIGNALELAAIREDWTTIRQETAGLTAFLAQVDVVYRR
jgi:HPt (histidine-containing phosphotransfer) domain-containing protein